MRLALQLKLVPNNGRLYRVSPTMLILALGQHTYLCNSGSFRIVALNNCEYWNHHHGGERKQPAKEFSPSGVRLFVITNTTPLNQACYDNNLCEKGHGFKLIPAHVRRALILQSKRKRITG